MGIVFVVAPGGCKPLILFGVCGRGVVASSPFLMVAVFVAVLGCVGVVCELDSVFVFMPVFCF